jgi:hypothetical protein
MAAQDSVTKMANTTRHEDDEELRVIFEQIRVAQSAAADAHKQAVCALQKQALHEEKCDGRQQVIQFQLRLITWLLTAVASALGTVGMTLIVRAIK